jgi:hypothetical protein
LIYVGKSKLLFGTLLDLNLKPDKAASLSQLDSYLEGQAMVWILENFIVKSEIFLNFFLLEIGLALKKGNPWLHKVFLL